MKLKRHEGGELRQVLAGMVTDATLCSRIASQWKDGGLFDAPWANLVGSWCVKHLQRYGEPPNGQLRGLFEQWATKGQRPEETVQAVERFLVAVSDEYQRQGKPPTTAYLLDVAERYFNRVRVKRAIDDATEDLDENKVADAERKLAEVGRVELGSSYVKVSTDYDAWRNAMDGERQKPLICYPKAAGKFLGDAFVRDALIAIMAPDKSYKSFFLQDAAFRAVRNRCRVAYFEAGDLSEAEVFWRLGCRTLRRPRAGRTVRWPIKLGKEGSVEYEDRHLDGVTPSAAFRAFRRTCRDKDMFRLSCHPNSTISVDGIRAMVTDWAREGWVADVVCIAEGSLVLTNRGLIPIEKVRCSDRLWDGVNWVSHGGLVYKGIKDVISYAGFTATPEHQVWTEDGWRTLESCARLGLRIAQTGDCRRSLWVGESYLSDNPCSLNRLQKVRKSLLGRKEIRLCAVCTMWLRKMGYVWQHSSGNIKGMSKLFATQKISDLVAATVRGGETTVSESQEFCLGPLWGAWNRVSFSDSFRSVYVDCGEHGSDGAVYANRQDRQRWSLRTGKSSVVHKQTELSSYSKVPRNDTGLSLSADLPVCDVCGQYPEDVFSETNVPTSDCQSLESDTAKMWKSPVWDLLNAGPFHRFTVQGVLTHNCIDYADILAPPAGVRETLDQIDATWRHLRRLSQELHCLVITATQASALAYSDKGAVLGKKHFSGRKTKLAHVNGMLGMVVTAADRDKGLARLNWVVRRDARYSEAAQLLMVGCLDCGCPLICASLG